MKVPVYNNEGKIVEEMELPTKVFDVPQNTDLVYQVATTQMANRRQVIAHTKHRGEVSGGGKKPWAQKHTGRARHGSIRSPLWRKGGVVFGPRKNRVYAKSLNNKMRVKALLCVLSEKARNNFVVVLDQLNMEAPKTRVLVELLKKLPLKQKTTVLALAKPNKNLFLAGRNISTLHMLGAKELNVFDLLSSQFIVMPKDAIKTIEDTFLKK